VRLLARRCPAGDRRICRIPPKRLIFAHGKYQTYHKTRSTCLAPSPRPRANAEERTPAPPCFAQEPQEFGGTIWLYAGVPMNRLPLKIVLQGAIDSGQIANMHQLLEQVRMHGLEITRNGRDYLGVRGADGKRFRVHFSFDNHTRATAPAPRGVAEAWPVAPSTGGLTPLAGQTSSARIFLQQIWVYALTASSRDGNKRACYVGKTVNLPRRMREHIRVRTGKRPADRTSYSNGHRRKTPRYV
jgi:hypothetical protein